MMGTGSRKTCGPRSSNVSAGSTKRGPPTLAAAQLERERHKLLEAHYSDAIPLDLFRSEQQRIARELVHAAKILRTCTMQFDQIEQHLDECLDLLDDAHKL